MFCSRSKWSIFECDRWRGVWLLQCVDRFSAHIHISGVNLLVVVSFWHSPPSLPWRPWRLWIPLCLTKLFQFVKVFLCENPILKTLFEINNQKSVWILEFYSQKTKFRFKIANQLTSQRAFWIYLLGHLKAISCVWGWRSLFSLKLINTIFLQFGILIELIPHSVLADAYTHAYTTMLYTLLQLRSRFLYSDFARDPRHTHTHTYTLPLNPFTFSNVCCVCTLIGAHTHSHSTQYTSRLRLHSTTPYTIKQLIVYYTIIYTCIRVLIPSPYLI